MCVSLVGLNKLLAIISPMFTAFYAVGLSLLLIILLRKVTPNDTANRGALYVVTVFAVAELLIAYVPNMPVISTGCSCNTASDKRLWLDCSFHSRLCCRCCNRNEQKESRSIIIDHPKIKTI